MRRASIIIPVKNCESTIADLLSSIANLDYPKDLVEVIIVDGGSTDRTIEIASGYPVKIIEEPGLGPGYGRMVGVKHSRGDILAFTDGDCVVSSGWLKAISRDLEDPSIGCVGGSILLDRRYSVGFSARYFEESIIRVMPLSYERRIYDKLLPFKHLAFANLATRRDILENVGGIDIGFKTFEDMDLLQRICDHGYKILFDPDVYVWHKHRQSIGGLLKQVYRYGSGGSVFRRKHPRSMITQWYRIGLALFYTIVSAISASIALSPIYGLLPVVIASLPVISGYTGDAIYYLRKTRSTIKSTLYPLLDIAVIISFCLGDTVSNLKSVSYHRSEA
ncbi:MAG: glycosyltransferase [Candidatus Bathyarchaeia archaeon]